jgi:hypothetical protein
MNLIDQIVRQVSLLPKEAQVEVLDFVGYLASQYRSASPTEDEAWDQVSEREPRRQDSPEQEK